MIAFGWKFWLGRDMIFDPKKLHPIQKDQSFWNHRSKPMWLIIWKIPSFLENHLLSFLWNEALNLTWCGLEWQKDRMKWCNLSILFMWSHFFPLHGIQIIFVEWLCFAYFFFPGCFPGGLLHWLDQLDGLIGPGWSTREGYHTQPSPFFQRIAAQDAKTRERERER